jgi:hypothetical protein
VGDLGARDQAPVGHGNQVAGDVAAVTLGLDRVFRLTHDERTGRRGSVQRDEAKRADLRGPAAPGYARRLPRPLARNVRRVPAWRRLLRTA